MISVLVPSRGRPGRLARLLQSIRTTALHDGVEVLVRIDEDDDAAKYRETLQSFPDVRSMLTVGPRPVYMSDVYDELYRTSDGDALCYCADDVEFGHTGWDCYAAKTFADRPVTLLCDSDEGDTPIHGFVSRLACDALGYLFPPGYEHGYVDQYLHRLYLAVGRMHHSPLVKMHHMHWHADGMLYDRTYEARSVARDAKSRTCDDRDRVKFERDLLRIEAEADKLRKLL